MDNNCFCKIKDSSQNDPDKIKMSYGYCYVPIQSFEKLFEPEQALAAGTLFKELYLPITEYGI